MSEKSADAIEQQTLAGGTIIMHREKCEGPFCFSDAEFRVRTLEYDGTGWAQTEALMCPTCAFEETAPINPSESDKADRLDGFERLKQ